ncbi:MAG TPA: hypothetical protein V6D11_30380 [Waterburya sp.]|jgi:hypothetical protein
MKQLMPFLLSAVLLSSTVACRKPVDQTSSNSPSANPNKVAGSNSTKTIANNAKNQQAVVPAGTSFDTVLQQDLSTGKSRNNERFTMRVKNSLLGGNKILKDAEVQGHLEDVAKAARGKKASLHLVFDDIMLKDGSAYPIDATLVNTQVESKTKGKFIQNAGIILGGAAAGHFLGNKAKFKHGGLAGGATAAAFVLSSPGGEVVLKKGTTIKLKLKSAIQ